MQYPFKTFSRFSYLLFRGDLFSAPDALFLRAVLRKSSFCAYRALARCTYPTRNSTEIFFLRVQSTRPMHLSYAQFCGNLLFARRDHSPDAPILRAVLRKSSFCAYRALARCTYPTRNSVIIFILRVQSTRPMHLSYAQFCGNLHFARREHSPDAPFLRAVLRKSSFCA